MNRIDPTTVQLEPLETLANRQFHYLLDQGTSAVAARDCVALAHPELTPDFLDWLVN